MAVRLPPLGGLRLFEAAARCGSFKQAALELNLTPKTAKTLGLKMPRQFSFKPTELVA